MKMPGKEQRTKVAIVAGSSNPSLAKEIATQLDVPLCDAGLDRFPDGEIKVQIKDTVRGADVFVIQSTSPPVNENLMELLLLIDALKRASAGRIIAVIPYYGYARQDRVCQAGEPLSAKLVANLIQTAGASCLVTIDLHSRQIQGFFDIPVYHLETAPLFAQYFENLKGTDAVILSPDAGGLKRARAVAELLDLPLACVEKRRFTRGKPEALELFGNVEGKRAIVIDDILSTGHTLIEAARLLCSRGAEEVHAAVTHGLFVGEAIRDLEQAPLERLVITDTVTPKVSRVGRAKVEIISVSRLLGDEIMRLHKKGW